MIPPTFAEAYSIGSNYKLRRLTQFSLDDDEPPMNGLVIWEPPRKGFEYVVGVDPSWGLGEDRAAIHVMRKGTIQALDTQVAEFCTDTMNVHELTPICYMIGNLYKDEVEDVEALMSVECNMSDDIVFRLRNDYNYGNIFIRKKYDNITHQYSNQLGWKTDLRTRPLIISKGIHYVKQDWWDLSSPWLFNELQTIEKKRKDDDRIRDRIEAAAGAHDDLAMAAFIALWSAHDMEFNEFGTTEELAKQRDRRDTGHLQAYEAAPQKPLSERRDFINTPCSAEDAESFDSLSEIFDDYKNW